MASLVSDARTTVTEVKDIIDTKLSDGFINAFINTANNVVDNNLLNKGLSSETLELIEQWLAAHFLSTRDQRVSSRTTSGEYVVNYQGKTDMGLKSTFYGQQVLILDSTGTLESMDEGNKRVSISAVDFSLE